jgi:predicted GIY-YIG superfamily endonuclease
MVPKALGKLSQVLWSTKDVVDKSAQSGIYEIQCQTCSAIYYGQTRRNIDKRFKEHMSMVRTRAEEKSSVAKHLLNNPGHVITPEDLSMVKKVDRQQHFEAWESIAFCHYGLWKHRVITN